MKHVVVFDQDRCVASLIRQILEEANGCRVIVTRDCAELLSRLASGEEMSVMIVDTEPMNSTELEHFCHVVRNLRPELRLVLTFRQYQTPFDPGNGALRLFKPFSNRTLRDAVAGVTDPQGISAAISDGAF